MRGCAAGRTFALDREEALADAQAERLARPALGRMAQGTLNSSGLNALTVSTPRVQMATFPCR